MVSGTDCFDHCIMVLSMCQYQLLGLKCVDFSELEAHNLRPDLET
jgi:hypothetical protein